MIMDIYGPNFPMNFRTFWTPLDSSTGIPDVEAQVGYWAKYRALAQLLSRGEKEPSGPLAEP